MIRATLALAAALSCAAAFAQTGGANPLPVTADNFVRAETDMYFALFVKMGAMGKFSSITENYCSKNPSCAPTAIRSTR